jgi:flagellar secretion chaperone FliS
LRLSDTKTKALMYNPYSNHLDSQVLSATPLQLIQLAYEGASESVRQARVHLAAKQIFERSRAISKAQELLAELSRSLDFAAGGDMSVRLAALYDYMQRRLAEANQRQIEAPLQEVENLLQTLSEGWKELAQAELQSSAMATVSASAGNSGDSASSAPSWALPVTEPMNQSSFSYSL